jgi:hypothetical protein
VDFARIEKAILASPKWREATEAITAAVQTSQRTLTAEEKGTLSKLAVLATILSDQNVFRVYADELYTNSAR